MTVQAFLNQFKTPDPRFGPVPAWWWSGDALDWPRMRWQMDQMHAMGIRNLVIINLAPGGTLFGSEPDDPPFLSEAEGVEWALRSITFAFDCGATCVSVIPTRAGNGVMERLQAEGFFSSPKLTSLEYVLAAGIEMQRGRVFADTWDAARFSDCTTCAAERVERLRQMNLSQTILPVAMCAGCKS